MLEQLVRHAEPGSPRALDAQMQLAELLVEERPWESALLARRVLQHRKDDRLYAVMGLAFTILGHHCSARAAYRKALAIAPRCPSYAHNLGHLLDVVFNQPHRALHWLSRALKEAPDEPEICASYAHALLRAGKRREAHRLLVNRLKFEPQRAKTTLNSWLATLPAP